MSITTVYRMFADDGRLLYVGISSRAAMRWEQHRHDKPWWSEVARISVEHFPTRVEGLIAEATAITVERPLHNVAGAVGGVALMHGPMLSDELERPKKIGSRSLLLRWPVAERLAEQLWHVVRSRYGTWAVGLVVDGWYTDKRLAQESLSSWADELEEGALVLPENWTP